MDQRTEITVTCSGGAGTSTGTGTSKFPVTGAILSVYWDAATGAPSSADLNVKEANQKYPKTVLNKLNTNTDQWFQPRDPLHLASDGSVISGGNTLIFVNDNLLVTIDQANNGQVFHVSIQWDDMK